MLWLKRMVAGALFLISSLLLAYWSILYTRPFSGVVGNLCLKTDENPIGYCYEMLPKGGFPFAFMWDNGGASVVGRLSWIEDDFRVLPFLGNWAFYISLLGLLYVSCSYLRARAK